MPQKIFSFGGTVGNPVINVAPANGFVPETYIPMMRSFLDSYQAVSLLPRTLWGDRLPPEVTPTSDWGWIGEDLLAGIQRHEIQNLIAIGHSSGGIGTLLAALQEPQHFRALILLDPVIPTRKQCQMMAQVKSAGTADQLPLTQMALRRRSSFESIEEAYQRFRGKGLFADWPDEAVRLYAEYGTQSSENGVRSLTWPPEWEAYIFSTVHTQIWDLLPRVQDLGIPLLIASGGSSDTFIPEAIEDVRELIPRATYRSIEGHGHLFPQSAPAETAAMVAEWLDSIP